MNIWQVPSTGIWSTAPGSLPAHDVLGVFPVPVVELATAARLGIPRTLLAWFFPRSGDHVALSRSGAYYAAATGLPAVPALQEALRTVDRHPGAPVGALRRGLVENLHNLYAAAAYAMWEHLTDQPIVGQPASEQALDLLFGAATLLAADLAGLSAPGWADQLPASLPAVPATVRMFRELDSQPRIRRELAFLVANVLDPTPDITTLIVPLYGSLSLGLAARAVLPVACPGRPVTVHLIRLGFHDLAGISYHAPDGTIRLDLTGPPGYCDRLAAAVRDGHALVVDDNVGYGTTLRAARALVGELGGHATTRSVETAWHLYTRSGHHDIADAADLPGLRPNLHHSIQRRLIGHLQRGDVAAYTRDPAHATRGTLHAQMAAAYELALCLGTWTPRQLAAMRSELREAAHEHAEPPVPAPPPPGARDDHQISVLRRGRCLAREPRHPRWGRDRPP